MGGEKGMGEESGAARVRGERGGGGEGDQKRTG